MSIVFYPAAALNGYKNSDVLEWLLDHAPNNEIRKNIFITSMYELFRRAVASGNVSELQWLWNHAPSYTTRNHMFDNLDEFSGNIQNLDVLEWLLHHVSDDIPRRIFYTSESNFFSQALVRNDQSELQRLWNIANNPKIRQHMLNNILDRRHSFGRGIINFGTFRWLLEHTHDSQKRSIFNTNIFRLFSEAVTSGNVSELQWLWSNSYNNYEMQVKIFGNLVSGQLDQNVVDLDTLKWLWNHAPNDEVKRSIFVANMSKLFRRAVASGNVSELQWLWGNASNNEKRQIFIDNIFMAMNSRNVEVLEWFWNEVFDDEMLNAFRTAASKVFATAASHEDIDGLQWFWDHLPNNVRNEVFRKGITDAFVLNQKLASLDMLKWFWNNTPDNQIQGQIFRRNMNHFFREVIISRNVNGLQWLLNSAPDNQAKSEMLNKGIEFIFLLNQLQSEKGVGLLEWFWNNVSENEALDILKGEVNGSFTLAIASENVSKLEWFWDNAPSDEVRMEMLKVNEYQPLVDVIRNPNLALLIGKFKSFIDGRLVANSGSIRTITAQEWVKCLKALEESRENRALNFVRDDIISLLDTKLIEEVKKAYKKPVETEDSSKPQPGSSYENGQKCKRFKKHSKRGVPKVLCMDSRDEEDVIKEEEEQRIKELFDTDKIKQIANNVKFQDQLFKVSEQISKGKVVDQNIEVLVTEIKNIDLSSVDPEIRDIVREISDNAENEEKVKNVLKGHGVAEKIRKVAEDTGLAFTVFLVGKHIASGDAEGLSYDALNLWIMPKSGEKISERILALGTELDSQVLKALSLSIRYSISNFAAFLGLEQSIKARQNAQDPVNIKIADLNIATNSIFIAADVPAIVTGTMSLTGMEVGLIGEFTGPFGAVVSVADIIISQFVEAELELEKLEERISLTGWEKLESYFSNLLDIGKPSNIDLDIFAQGCYSKYIDIKNKDYYDQVTYSLPNILVTTRKSISCFGFLPCYTKITSLSAELKHNISVNVEPRGIVVSSDISRIIPGTVGSFKVICGPLDRDIKEKIITKKEEGGRSLEHSEEVKELSLQEYQKNVANCEGTVVYRKKGVFNPLKLLIFLPNPNAHLYVDPRDNLDIYFTGENIISRIPPSAPHNTDYYGVHRYYFPNQVILCNISNSADHFFYITGKKNFHCNIVKASIKQRNTVVIKGNFTDFENIHFVFGSNSTNHIEVSNAKYVDGKGGSDVITVNNFATVKSYFGDSIRGNCSVLLPMNFSDIDSITYTDNIMNIYNKDREFISVDGQKSFKTADSLFVTLMKIDSTTSMATNLHVMKTVDIASNMDNPNFKITKQTSYGSNHVTIGGDGNYIFYPDKENHTFYWEAHDNMKHLYLFSGRDNNFSVGKANGILDFSHSAKKELLPKIIDEGKVQFYDEDRKLRVTLLPNYKNVVVTFDRYKYYRLQGEKLERDYCSHDLKIDGRFYVDVRELLYLYNCFTFSGDKILFIRQRNNLVLVSAKGLLLMLDYYHVYDYWWDFSIRLDNSIIEPEELKKRADNPSSLRYYHPYKEVLQIYHNQPINKHQIGLVDLEGKSILDFNMKIVGDSLVMLHKNDTFVVVENWNNYEPSREMMFAFNEVIVSNAKCLVSNCDPKDIIKDFEKEKRKAGVNIEKYSKKLKEEKTLQRKHRHHYGDRPRHHDHLSRKLLAIDLGNQPERQDTSKGLLQNDEIGYKKATSEPTSWINVFAANTMVGGVKGISQFIFSLFKPAIGMTQPSKAMATQGIDTNGTLLLLDVFIRKITGQKYISTADHFIISLPEAKCYASDIINGFEKLLKETAVKSGISVTNLNFDPIKPQSDIVGQLINGKFSEILKTLYLSAKQACPEFKQNKKFLSRLNPRIEEFLDKKGKEFSSIDLKCKEVKQTRKRELYGSANFITDNHTTLSLANTSRSESQLPGKTDDKPRTYLNDSTVDNQLQRSL